MSSVAYAPKSLAAGASPQTPLSFRMIWYGTALSQTSKLGLRRSSPKALTYKSRGGEGMGRRQNDQWSMTRAPEILAPPLLYKFNGWIVYSFYLFYDIYGCYGRILLPVCNIVIGMVQKVYLHQQAKFCQHISINGQIGTISGFQVYNVGTGEFYFRFA